MSRADDSFRRAQAAYENLHPPEEWECGECRHVLPGDELADETVADRLGHDVLCLDCADWLARGEGNAAAALPDGDDR